ncbi:uncharacterized protein LOC144748328 isoform X2 [Ciona intestinalis]
MNWLTALIGFIATSQFLITSGFGQNNFTATTAAPGICNVLLNATHTPVDISSPNYPNFYPDRSSCWWNLISNNPRYQVQLTLKTFDTETCCDYLQINNGTQNALVKLQGSLTNRTQTYVSSNQSLHLYFYSDGSVSRTGFIGSYKLVLDQCLSEAASNCTASGGTCHNGVGSFICKCPTGMLEINGSCTDINECAVNNPCHSSARCFNTHGSFECMCPPGFYGTGILPCRNISDASPCYVGGFYRCNYYASCTNISGQSVCWCRTGFYGNGHQCQDVNECEFTKEKRCNATHGGRCFNSYGSYTCQCDNGYRLDNGQCADVNECTQGRAYQCTSYHHGTCVNTQGSYYCNCSVGYRQTSNGKSCRVTCGGNLTASLVAQNITSPFYPSRYPNNAECIWNITSPSPQYQVQLTVVELKTESCCDYLQVENGTGSHRMKGNLGGGNITFISANKKLNAKFHTDGSVTHAGFIASYVLGL